MSGLEKLVGLRREKALARIEIAVCKRTGEVCGHTLLTGLGGLGKTELALAIAEELGYYSIVTEAAALKTRAQIVRRLFSANELALKAGKPLLLFVDEVQRLTRPLQEVFYYPMDRSDPRIIEPTDTFHLRSFTLVAATTRQDGLDQASFVKRFDNIWRIKRYSVDDLIWILMAYFNGHGYRIGFAHVRYLAIRCLGIPRQANRLAKKVRNVFLASDDSEISMDHCKMATRLEGLDQIGLEELHVEYLRILVTASGPLGIGGIAGRLGQQVEVVEDTIEPTLLFLGLIDRGSRGRVITPKGVKHLSVHHETVFRRERKNLEKVLDN